jgi:tape measure domain-containing protein
VATSIGHLAVLVSANTSGFQTGVATVQKGVGSMASAVQSRTGAIVTSFGAMARSIGAVAGTIGLVAGFKKAITGFAVEESNLIAFETLLGSMSQAKSLMEDLQRFGAETPFQFPELASAAKNLAAFGMSADDIIPKLRMIGDIASLLNQPIGEMATLYGKAKVSGVLMSEDINQFTERGVPLIQALAKQFGVAEIQIKKMASESKISFADMDKALTSLTSNGGRFAGGMEKQSKSIGGLWSSLMDNIESSLTKVGGIISETFQLKPVLTWLNGVTGAMAQWIKDIQTKAGLIGKMVQVTFANAGDYIKVFFMEGGLFLGSFVNDMVYAFTVTLPEVFRWFADNWRTMLGNLGNMTQKFISDLVGQFAASLPGVPEVAKKAMELARNVPAQIDKIAPLQLSKRAATEWEEGMAKKIGDTFAGMAARSARMGVELAAMLTKPGAFPEEKKPGAGVGTVPAAQAAEKAKRDEEKKFAGAFEVGSKEAYNLILASRQMDRTPMEKTAKATADTAKNTGDIKEAIGELDDAIRGIEGFGVGSIDAPGDFG